MPRGQVLKQKRLLETQRDQLFNQQFNMEQTSFALESIKDSAQTVAAMKQAGQELKAAFKSNDLNISSIEKLQDEMADYMVCLPALASSTGTGRVGYMFLQVMGLCGPLN